MGFHSFCQKLKYNWYAKNRHGVHSPFVYDFVEMVLNGKFNCKSDRNFQSHLPENLSERQKNILNSIVQYYSLSEIIKDNKLQSNFSTEGNGKLFLLQALSISDFNFAGNDIAVVFDIHQTNAHSVLWKQLHENPAVKMSFDLFDMGILMSRPEFKVKQHFILK